MTCCILMLISLVSSVWGTFVVNVAQSSYQAEENGDVTLEWTFTTTTHSSSISLNIFCQLFTGHRVSVLFHLHEGVEVPESQDEQFSGRVQWDTDVLREGRLRLHVSRLRTDDSGVYLCEVNTGHDGNSDRCLLNITAARGRPEPETEPERPNTAGGGRIGLYCGAGLTAAALLTVGCFLLFNSRPRKQDFYPESSGGSEETV